MVCAVSFTRHGRLHYATPGSLTPAVGDQVLVSTSAGPEVAQVVWGAQEVWDVEPGVLPELVGMAADADLERDAAARKVRAQTRVAAKRLVREHGLPMKVSGVDYLPEGAPGGQVTIWFTAPGRVDFRQLVKDLGATLRMRVELRQLSPRDEAKLMGGIGSCGRELCCSTFLTDFEPITLRMVRDQDLPLNPLKISGACGKLMCCLKYEHPLYADFKESAPALGSRAVVPDGEGGAVEGTVVGHDALRDRVVVSAKGGGRCSCAKADVCGSRAEFDERYGSPAEPADG